MYCLFTTCSETSVHHFVLSKLLATYFYKHENINKIFGKRREIFGTSVYYSILVIEQQRFYQSFIYNFSLHANTLEYIYNVCVGEICSKTFEKQGND